MSKLHGNSIKKSFFISLAYVGLGTVCVLPIFVNTFIEGDWMIFATLLTLPVNFISVSIMYVGGANAITRIIIVQFAYFLLFWFIVYRIIKPKEEKAERYNPPPG